jgi:hypothetical protein
MERLFNVNIEKTQKIVNTKIVSPVVVSFTGPVRFHKVLSIDEFHFLELTPWTRKQGR